MNKVILMGRLTRDPEVRYSQGDNATAIARFTLAVDEDGDRFWCHFKSNSVEVMKRRYERYQEQKKRKRMKRSTERRRPLGEQGPIRYGAEYKDDWTL